MGNINKQYAIDWMSYLGDWYEVARLPSFFEPATYTDAKAKYYLQGNQTNNVLMIENTATDTLTGELKTAIGVASIDITDLKQNSLTVKFDENAPSAKYIVLEYVPGDYSIVGTSDKSLLWLLVRDKKNATPALFNRFYTVAMLNGYSRELLSKLIYTR